MADKVDRGVVYALNSKGKGLVRPEGEESKAPVELSKVLIGEKVSFSAGPKRRRVREGQLVAILEPSPLRVSPPCQHAAYCGGCSCQHLDYPEQLKEKQRILLSQFGQLAESATVYPIVPCDPPWHYRNKMEFSFSATRKGERFLGLVKEGRYRDVFNIVECLIAPPWMTAFLSQVRKWWDDSTLPAYNPRAGVGLLKALTLREGVRTGQRMVILTVTKDPFPQEELDRFAELVPEGVSLYLRMHHAERGTPTQTFDRHLKGPTHLQEILRIELDGVVRELHFQIGPAAFFQPNTRQAEKLYARAIALANLNAGERVYDLYCGTGSLGLCAALKAGSVLGIELCQEAVEEARRMAQANQLPHMEFLCGSVGKELGSLQGPKPDVVLVDPPRAGLESQAVACLTALAPSRILYVSCNPETQARDAALLVQAGYTLKALQAVDQFPHTRHLENIALFIKT